MSAPEGSEGEDDMSQKVYIVRYLTSIALNKIVPASSVRVVSDKSSRGVT